MVDRADLASLEVKRGVEAEASLPVGVDAESSWLYFRTGAKRTSLAVYLKGSFPLFRASHDDRSLELLCGRRLRDLAPRCTALQDLDEQYSIVAVNGIMRNASGMAEELRNPPAAL